MTDLNKINFMSQERFNNLESVRDDELYVVKTDIAEKEWVMNYVSSILTTIYPVGSIYIGTQNTCPMEELISGSVWEKVSSGRVLQGSDSEHNPDTTIEAGLPNITAGANVARGQGYTYNASGAFYDSADGTGGNWDSAAACRLSFDASRSNSIYGSSNTVQPPAYVVNIWKRIS